ncbi:MAG: trigger factor [bacterium]
MKNAVHHLQKNTVEITVELSPEEVRPHLQQVAEHISRHRSIPGFRPGKAPVAVVEKVVGTDVLYHEAAERIIRGTYPTVLHEQKLTTVGAPEIELLKVAPGNPLIYKATVALLPKVALGEYRGLRVKKRPIMVTEEEVEKLLRQLRESRGTETLVTRPAAMGDKVEIDFVGSLNGVPVERASSKTHPVLIGAKHFVPGFEEQLCGLRAGEQKRFSVRFPKDYATAHLADRIVDFDVTMRAVYAVALPPLNDAFATSLGKFADLAALKKQLRKNIEEEKEKKERERYELALLEKIADISTFGELPDRLLDGETEKMLEELRHDLEAQGMVFDQYLESIKKTAVDLKKEFRPRAERRVRTALVTRAIAEKEHIDVSDQEVQKEIEETRRVYQGNTEMERNLASPEYARFLKNVLTTKRVTEFLDELIGVAET